MFSAKSSNIFQREFFIASLLYIRVIGKTSMIDNSLPDSIDHQKLKLSASCLAMYVKSILTG